MPKTIIPPSQESMAPLQRPMVVVNRTMARDEMVKKHRHDWGQFIYANHGVLRVVSNSAQYVVPSQQGVWMPPQQWHEVSALTDTELTSFYVDVSLLQPLPAQCKVLKVTSFMQALIYEAKRIPKAFSWASSDGRLLRLILDRIVISDEVELQLPSPTDKRLCLILETILSDPSSQKTINEWGKEVGASARTLSRLFKKETGLTYSEWKQRLNTQLAIRQLYDGANVTEISLNLGYQSVSAFIYMFKNCTGSTPSSYKHNL